MPSAPKRSTPAAKKLPARKTASRSRKKSVAPTVEEPSANLPMIDGVNAARRVQGRATAREIARLRCQEGKRLPEIAQILDLHPVTVRKVWSTLVKKANAGHDEATLAEVRAFCLWHLQHAIETGSRNLSDSASYGAVVLRGIEKLAELTGLQTSEDGPATPSQSVAEIAAHVRRKAPLLAAAFAWREGESVE